MSVDLPTLGKPIRATSAWSLSSRSNHRSSPTSPCSAKAGARRWLERKRALPWPPRPALGGAASGRRGPSGRRAVRPRRRRPSVPTGTGDDDVLAPRAVLALRGPVLAVGGAAKGVVAEAQERRLVVVGLEPDVAALAAVAAVGTALGDVGLATKADAARSPVSGFGVQLRAIDEGRTSRHPTRGPRWTQARIP